MLNDIHLQAIERAMVALRRRQTRRAIAQHAGLTQTGIFDVLDAVEAAELDHQPATVSHVAQALHVDQPRASKLVAAAVEAGLVRREADQADGRRSRLVRTSAGRTASKQVHDARIRAFAQATAEWSNEERAIFAHLLQRFVDGLDNPAAS